MKTTNGPGDVARPLNGLRYLQKWPVQLSPWLPYRLLVRLSLRSVNKQTPWMVWMEKTTVTKSSIGVEMCFESSSPTPRLPAGLRSQGSKGLEKISVEVQVETPQELSHSMNVRQKCKPERTAGGGFYPHDLQRRLYGGKPPSLLTF